MTLFYPGVAGKRPGKPKGVVPHNDAGSQYATAAFYRGWLPTHQAESGFAHVYISNDGRYQAESYDYMAWHTANSEGNAWYVGWEACQSMGDEAIFRENEQKCFADMAVFMKDYGLYPSVSTVKLHKEFSSTSCPHRSVALHGQSTEAVRAYFIAQILKYYGGVVPTPETSSASQGGLAVWNKWQSVDVDVLNVRAAQSSASRLVSQLKKGQKFLATRIYRGGENVNGYTSWFEVNGVGWVSGALVTETTTPAAENSSWVTENGSFYPSQTINVRDKPSRSGNVAATYQAGQGPVNYDRYLVAEGYVWIHYVSHSNQNRYMAVREVGKAAWGSFK